VVCVIAACKSVPVAPVVPAAPPAPVIPIDTKVSWILRLEQQRALRDPGTTPPAAPASTTGPAATTAFVPASTPDLVALALDPSVAVRRRALLAIGRVGIRDGIAPLTSALQDPEPDVRGTAAFALGLLGAKEAIAPLTAALADQSPLVRGRASEGLGLIGDASAAPAVARAAGGCAAQLAPIEPDDEALPKSPEIEACRLALFSLVRLRQYDSLAAVALDSQGHPVSRWWPIAFALQRINDRRAVPALLELMNGPGIYTASFAVRGLGTAKDQGSLPAIAALAGRQDADVKLRVAAIRAVGQIGGAPAADALLKIVSDPSAPQNLVVEAVTAMGATGVPKTFPTLVDLFSDAVPTVRAAALAAAAKTDRDSFLVVISALARDPDWSVRAAFATVLGTLPADRVTPAVEDLVADPDARVHAAALTSLAALKAPSLAKFAFAGLEAPDFAERAAAARVTGEAKLEGGVPRLAAAYDRAQTDATEAARTAIVEALAAYGSDEAKTTIRRALSDPEWPVRLAAASALRTLGDAAAEPQRPAPLRQPVEFFGSPAVLHPSYSPHAFIETKRGTIEIELNVVEGALTSQSFMELARAGFFNGIRIHRLVPGFVIQAGDVRGDGEGGPGFTIRDEFSPIPYVRGTVGMALSGPDTGGSQWFITLSPQPHLDGKYAVFGRVVNGWELLDQISQWDVIERVRIWDGVTMR